MTKEALDRMFAHATERVRMLNQHLLRAAPKPDAELAQPAKRIRQASTTKLNKLEQEALGYLHARWPLVSWVPHCLKVQLGNGVWYLPDIVGWPSRDHKVQIYEVKGPWATDDAIVKLKVAARSFPCFDWWLMWKAGYSWKAQQVLP